ncbi:MAG: LPS export ABC transporter permease LptF [Terriglobia bacterium]
MKLLDRYIFREILGYAGLGLALFLFVLMTPEVLRLSELLARESIALPQMAQLVFSVLPRKLMWALPLSVLAGLLMAMSRLAADNEVIALHAAGVGRARLLCPVLAFAFLGAGLTLATTVWWGPLGARTVRQLRAQLNPSQLSSGVQPRVFDERFPNLILYVQDTEQGGARWRGVFLADVSQPANAKLTFAQRALVVPEPDERKLRLHLFDGSSHSYTRKQPDRYSVSTFAQNLLAISLPATGANLAPPRNADLSLAELWALGQQGGRWRSARADFYRRLALPAACLVFGLIALPLGLLAQRSGRAVGFVTAVALAISYYLIFIFGDRLARQGQLPPALGVWLANLTLFVPAIAFYFLRLPSLRFAGDWRRHLDSLRLARSQPTKPQTLAPVAPDGTGALSGRRFPRTLDLYVVRGVLFHSALFLSALVLLFALFVVLEMVDDIAAHNIGWPLVARFLWYLLPQTLYWMTPLALLLGLMVEMALLSKRNEIVAIKGAGISLYRIVVPICVLGLAVSALLFWLDSHYLAYANHRQELLRNQIKARPPQTFFQAHRRWLFGQHYRIYHFAFFDATRKVLARLNVLELDPNSFSLRRRLFARQAHWEPELQAWVLEQGWERIFNRGRTVRYQPFVLATFPELTEPPAYFQKEVLGESAQMDWRQLRDHMRELRQSGFDVTPLRVQWHKKFAFPLIAAIILPLAFPFGLSMGSRGALAGLALGMGLGFSYWVLAFGFFEPLGNLGLLPPLLAAWGPNLLFSFAAVYLILQIDT